MIRLSQNQIHTYAYVDKKNGLTPLELQSRFGDKLLEI